MAFVVVSLLLLLAAAAWAVMAFNGLVRLRNQVKAGWSDIDVQLMRRHDLIPTLVETVKAYAGHEKQLYERVAGLRAEALGARSPARLADIEAALQHDVGRLILIKEAYPELKASENFLRLQRDLVDVEEHLQFARRFYNGAVRELNDGVQRFPARLVANAFGFGPAEFFDAPEGAAAVPALGLAP
jgi:LemA protein